MVKNILITGASGLIGTRLTTLLHEKGYRIAHLSRTTRSGNAQTFLWNVDKNQLDPAAIQPAHAIIHLAGAGVADKPWTKERKNEIISSRTLSTRLLYDELKKGNHQVRTFISASGIGYYGSDDSENFFTENDKTGDDFLADVVRRWEEAADQIAELGIRVVKIRIGVVLSEKGGALQEIMRPVKFYAGAPLGSGKQYVSWIHLDDLCNLFIKTLEDETLQGVYNAVAPHPVTNKELTYAIAKALNKPLIIPAVPSFVLKLLLGEMADLVLKGAKVSGQKIQSAGFRFKFEHIQDALKDLLVK
ncbi:TIGR01777 family oxidoreductase [Chryseolinea sp. H1M3-3]|uniref:TIGR01777 family oxidoreductase n=1 Tax=Chryseolinea sp. H1M3-3 TaxID=3034144 RepID=UPI0023EC5CA9|nr:TIGR01777 family oxidoreductase [Chryseolinea sp. H1M3-3]